MDEKRYKEYYLMLKEFFTNTIENTFLKALISNTCLPNINTVV